MLLVFEESGLERPSFIELARKTIMYQIALLKSQILCPVLMIRYKKKELNFIFHRQSTFFTFFRDGCFHARYIRCRIIQSTQRKTEGAQFAEENSFYIYKYSTCTTKKRMLTYAQYRMNKKQTLHDKMNAVINFTGFFAPH